jgi:hypothetical protein
MSKRIPLPQYQAHWFAKDYTNTARRVGFTQRKRLRWLVEDFASRLNYEALAPNLTPERLVHEITVFIGLQCGAGFADLGELPDLPARELQPLAHMVREGIERFADGEPWRIEVRNNLDRVLRRRPGASTRADESHGRSSWSVRWPARRSTQIQVPFLLAAMDLLQSQGRWLTRCLHVDCRQLFMRDDMRQQYCSPRCSQVARVRRFRRKSAPHRRAIR